MNGRPDDLRLLGELLGQDPFRYLLGRRLLWVRDLGHAISAWEVDERPFEDCVVVCVGFDAHRDPGGRNYGSVYRDIPRARLAVELLARCERPEEVVLAVTEAERSAAVGSWTAVLLRECLHGSDLVADRQQLAVLELLAPQWAGTLAELLDVAGAVLE